MDVGWTWDYDLVWAWGQVAFYERWLVETFAALLTLYIPLHL